MFFLHTLVSCKIASNWWPWQLPITMCHLHSAWLLIAKGKRLEPELDHFIYTDMNVCVCLCVCVCVFVFVFVCVCVCVFGSRTLGTYIPNFHRFEVFRHWLFSRYWQCVGSLFSKLILSPVVCSVGCSQCYIHQSYAGSAQKLASGKHWMHVICCSLPIRYVLCPFMTT